MAPNTYLITGAAGFLGWNLGRMLIRGQSTVVGTWHHSKPDRCASGHCMQFDLEQDDAETLLAATSPDVVVHCAALASRAACEADPDLARRVNVDATRRLAEACAERDATFVFISTDLVFDGSRAPYREEDPVSPASVYAETKAAAELEVAGVCPKHYILRPALMYGQTAQDTPGSFLSWNVGRPAAGAAVQLYTNQYRMPLYAPDLARSIESLVKSNAGYGIYHCAGPERMTRYEIGLRIAEHFDLPAGLMEKTELPVTDDTSLVTEKVLRATGVEFMGLDNGLREIAQRIVF